VTAVLWHPQVSVMVLRVATRAGGERYVWVDLASKGIVKR
jgi:hypothetical protein